MSNPAQTSIPPSTRFDSAELVRFATELFRSAGLDDDKAATVAELLIEADRMGHSTHGLALAPAYLEAATQGTMKTTGEPEVVSDRGACVTWRGQRLPGLWLTDRAVELGLQRVREYGTVSIAIADSHHIGALAVYLPKAIEQGCLLWIASSLPSNAGVAPFGGARAVLTPDPLAAGIPAGTQPMLIDVSSSITTLNLTRQLAARGEHYPAPWAIDREGRPTTDPSVVLGQGGTLLPAGGLDHGHKGYGWALFMEALSQGLSGYGRADAPKGISLSVFVQVIDPEAFGGRAAFERQTQWLVDACRGTPPLPGVDRVRVPGERALQRRADSLSEGVPLAASVVSGLDAWARRFAVEWPSPLF